MGTTAPPSSPTSASTSLCEPSSTSRGCRTTFKQLASAHTISPQECSRESRLRSFLFLSQTSLLKRLSTLSSSTSRWSYCPGGQYFWPFSSILSHPGDSFTWQKLSVSTQAWTNSLVDRKMHK